METTLKFDKVVLIKELNDKIKKIGEVFEIASILNDDFFLLRDGKTRVAVGVVSFDDFEKHFVPVENFNGWTNWILFTGFDGQNDCMYRTNRRKIQVKFLTDNIRAESCCSKADEFNLSFGLQIAYLRCLNKALDKKKAECEKNIKMADSEIKDNEHIIKKMINSLEV